MGGDSSAGSGELAFLWDLRGGLPPVERRAVRRFRFSPTCSGEAVCLVKGRNTLVKTLTEGLAGEAEGLCVRCPRLRV